MKPSIYSWERRDTQLNRTNPFGFILKVIPFAFLLMIATVEIRELTDQSSIGIQPIVMAEGKQAELMTLCAQYRSDKLMTGEAMSREMVEACGF